MIKAFYNRLKNKGRKTRSITVQKITLNALCMQFLSEMQFQNKILQNQCNIGQISC